MLGILSFIPFFGGILGIPGIILGILELVLIKTGKSIGPKYMPITGIILSLCGLLIGIQTWAGLAAK